MKKYYIGKIVILLLFLGASYGLLYQVYMEKTYQIYEETFRFHIRAASDRLKDQEIKKKVRDAILMSVKEDTVKAKNAEEMEGILRGNVEKIRSSAEVSLKKYGRKEKVHVYFTKERFPVRMYGNVLFPAGEYKAMRVDIGKGKGHNWWCAFFPRLCYISEEDMEIKKEEEKELEKRISRKELKKLTNNIFFMFKRIVM